LLITCSGECDFLTMSYPLYFQFQSNITTGLLFGGQTSGTDRITIPGIKTYTQSTKTCDVVIGVHPYNDSFDLYFVPTILIEKLGQSSISLKKIESLKNNYEILDNCKNPTFVISKAKEYGILS